MGIGLDFDESYMGGVARSGHGNFGFVNDGPTLTAFLQRELKETAGTTIEAASVRVMLPDGVRFVRATGADARADAAGVELKVGSMYADEERRVLLELSANMSDGAAAMVTGYATWQQVGASTGTANIPALSLVAVADPVQVDRSRDGTVLARAASVAASERQLQAAEAYAQGDQRRADALIGENLAELHKAMAAAPAPVASSLAAQSASYESAKKDFDSVAPSRTAGKFHAKAAAAKNWANSRVTSSF
jgi:Ca-activated chloride channel family protein